MTPGTCPDRNTWQAILDAGHHGVEAEELVHHLDTCTACQQTLETLAADPLAWEDAAHGLGAEWRDAAQAPALRHAVERLQAEEHLLPGDNDLSFLQPTDRPDLLGLLGHHEVQAVIGCGGMGVVLKALDPGLNRVVAIKVLLPRLASSVTARKRFVREARAAAAVRHEHIVHVHAVSEVAGLPCFVMEYVAGESLQERLDRGGPLAIVDVVRIAGQVASALAAAHDQGLIHRDIKPANILLEGEPGASATGGRIKITDFGLARTADDVGLTQHGVVAGTPEYMAPEQARGETVDHRADLFSLGSVLYAMGTGRPPFQASTTMGVLRQVCEDAPPSLRSLNPEVPQWLEGLIARLMAKAPGDRIQSAAEVAELLAGYLSHLEQPSTPAPEFPPAPHSRQQVSRPIAALLAVAASLAALLLAQVPPTAQEPSQTEFYQDLRGATFPMPHWELTGPDSHEMTRREEKGLRVTLPAARQPGHLGAVGITGKFDLVGDFEITGTYELLSTEMPTGANGLGVALNVTTDADLRKFAKIGRYLRPKDGSVYLAEAWNKDRPGDNKALSAPATAQAGQMRLARKGSTVYFRVADSPDGAFREIGRWEFGTANIQVVRFVVTNHESPTPIDARLVDVRVRSTGLVSDESKKPAPLSAVVPRGPWRYGLVAIEILGLLVTLALAGWLYLRRGRRLHATAAPHPAPSRSDRAVAAAPTLSLQCPGCGKNLKARSGLAGKKLKCPHCGQPVVVSEGALQPGESGRVSPGGPPRA